MNNNRGPIGVFDSGIGGLTVAKAIKDLLPKEQVLYFGDTAHLPYGDKSQKSIQGYLRNIFAFLNEMNCKLVVIACNSASSVFDLDKDKIPTFDIPVIDVIHPVVNFTVDHLPSGNVGVIGTRRTIRSGIYERMIRAQAPKLNVKSLATPLLAPMIEDGFVNDAISHTVVEGYLRKLGPVDALILGCTHYPLIRREINDHYDHKVELIDAPSIVASQVKSKLSEMNALAESLENEDHFFVSDYTASFENTAKFFFGKKIKLEEKRL